MKCRLLFIILLQFCCLRMAAQDSIPQHRSYAVALGGRQFLDTYLSSEHYSGVDFAFLAERQRKSKWKNWAWLSSLNLDFASMDNRADNNKTIELMGDYRLLLQHYWQVIPERLWIAAGGGVGFNVGGAYNMRNQNNPAQLRVGLLLMPSVEAVYSFPVKRRDWIVRYSAATQLVGLAFTPKYGQSYYEISQDNAIHNFDLTTIATTPSLRQQLVLDIPVGKSFLRIGFLGNYRQSKLHKLKYHSYENSFIVGYSKYF